MDQAQGGGGEAGKRRKAPKGCFWRGDVLWGRISVAGRETKWSLRTDDVRVAARRRKERRDREVARRVFGDDRRTYAEAFVAWGAQIGRQVGASTAKRYASSLKQLEPWLLDLYLDEIDKPLMGEIIAGRLAAAVTIATVRRDLGALSSFCDFCEAQDWRPDNPALAALKRLKERRDPIVLPALADIGFVVAHCPGNLAALTRFALLEGFRQDEIVRLDRRQVDHARRQVTLHLTKGRRARAVQLSEAGYACLRAVPLSLVGAVVFWHSAGEPYRNVASRFVAIMRRATKAAKAAGREFRPFRFHHLRHRYAVDFLKSGGNLYDLQQHLGHRSVKTTEEFYLDYLTPDERRSAKLAPAQKAEQRGTA